MKTNEFEVAHEAICALDGCNLGGIVKCMNDARACLFTKGREATWLNNHPIMQVCSAKLVELTGMGLVDRNKFSCAYDAVRQMAKGTEGVYP